MASWLSGGQVKQLERDGATLHVKIMPAAEMIEFLKDAQKDPTGKGGLESYRSLVTRGLQGWSGDGVPPFSDDAVQNLSLAALQRVIAAVIDANSLTEDDRGNSHAS